jgi:TonB family protein
MAFRALLFSKSTDTNNAMTQACERAGIRAEVCSDIFTAIEKGKTRAFSCVMVDWADQPEASFLLKRARESVPNRETVAVAIVDREPTKDELRDSRLDFLIARPISPANADAVLAKACEKMQPMSAEDARESFEENEPAVDEISAQDSAASDSAAPSHVEERPPNVYQGPETAEQDTESAVEEKQSGGRGHAISFGAVSAAVLLLGAGFFLWSSREVFQYLSQTPEGGFHVLKDSFATLFNANKTGALPVSSASSDAQQDAYFSRGPSSNGQTPALKVAATESTLVETRVPLHRAPDFPLPTPVVEHQEVVPVHIQRVVIPDSMRNSAPIERPVVVTVNPAQMMPVSAPQVQPVPQAINEPVTVSEETERALLVHVVDPVYPSEGAAQKLHGPVVLQAVIGRDGTVQDLKIVRGYFILGKAAIAAVKQWRFQPYSLNGHAASTQTTITVDFSYPPG